MKTLRFVLLASVATLLSTGPAAAENIVASLVPPSERLTPGSTVAIDFVVFNPSVAAIPFQTEREISGVLLAGTQTWPVDLQAATAAPNEIAPGGFAFRRYLLTLPPDAHGRVIVELTRNVPGTLRAVLNVADGGAPLAEPAAAPLSSAAAPAPAASAIDRTFAGRLGAHEPVYFIYGPDAPNAKFQFSFKYQLLNLGERDDHSIPRTLQFAFTQRSLWDLDAASSPFYDTSYMPELMFESLAPMPETSDHWFTWLGYQAGFQHESNGREGMSSRSLNTLYFRPAFALGALDGWHLIVIPEVRTYIGGLSENPRLEDYRGYGRLRLVLGRRHGAALLFTGMAGKDFDHGSIQLDLTVPVRTRLLDFETYFLIQYFNGYGESLLSYEEKSETVRAGFSFIR